MGMGVSQEQKQRARKADLYDYLIKHQRGMVELEGNSLRLKNNKSISVKQGYGAYKDWSTNEIGNGIDLLTKYMGYSFVDAVKELTCEYVGAEFKASDEQIKSIYILPTMAADFRRIIKYLTVKRGIDKSIIQWLIDKELIYQDLHCNCVFANANKSFYELRGIYDTPYHRNGDNSQQNIGYWCFNNPDARVLTKAYICESAIDAISLYLLQPDDAYYISIAGVGNQQRIDAVKALGLEVITAFDNDKAGELGRTRNNDCKHVVPVHGCKDWNEQLVAKR